MASKYKNEILNWLNKNADPGAYISEVECASFYGSYLGRKVRYTESDGRFDIGDGQFDRWANSVACSFKVKPNVPLHIQLHKAIDFARKQKEYCTYIDMDA